MGFKVCHYKIVVFYMGFKVCHCKNVVFHMGFKACHCKNVVFYMGFKVSLSFCCTGAWVLTHFAVSRVLLFVFC